MPVSPASINKISDGVVQKLLGQHNSMAGLVEEAVYRGMTRACEHNDTEPEDGAEHHDSEDEGQFAHTLRSVVSQIVDKRVKRLAF